MVVGQPGGVPPARSTRKSGARPPSSAVTTRAAESGVQANAVIQRSQPGATSRAAPRSPRPRRHHDAAVVRGSVAVVRRLRRQATDRPSGETATGPSTRGRRRRAGSGAPSARDVEGRPGRARRAVRLVDPPGRDDRRPVRGDVVLRQVERAAGRRGEVGPGRAARRRRLGGDRGRREQPWPVRAEVVVPEPHRRALVQDRGHLGVLARLRRAGVVVGGDGAGQGRRRAARPFPRPGRRPARPAHRAGCRPPRPPRRPRAVSTAPAAGRRRSRRVRVARRGTAGHRPG